MPPRNKNKKGAAAAIAKAESKAANPPAAGRKSRRKNADPPVVEKDTEEGEGEIQIDDDVSAAGAEEKGPKRKLQHLTAAELRAECRRMRDERDAVKQQLANVVNIADFFRHPSGILTGPVNKPEDLLVAKSQLDNVLSKGSAYAGHPNMLGVVAGAFTDFSGDDAILNAIQIYKNACASASGAEDVKTAVRAEALDN